ncbi:MAG: flagellar basal body protein [Candidatus Caenarcaniphilales bacterium]|jgi:flagellar hook-associated protein FlgK|nr:flagellar basal body protein [Candidatus Caenarcaniphilales bacterium]
MTFNGLDISVSGMLTAQVGLDATSNNIANANTEGYTRKVVHYKEGVSVENGGNSKIRLLSGVLISSLDRVRNAFLDQQVRKQSSNSGRDSALYDIAIAMNDILGEPSDSGLTSKINKFFQSANDLAANPELQTAKTVFINSADALADVFNQIDTSIGLLKGSLEAQPSGLMPIKVKELNEKLELLAEVHQKALALNSRGSFAAELEDQRDLLLDQVSNLLNFDIVRRGGGELSSLNLQINASEALVTSSTAFPNTDSAIPGITPITNSLVLEVNNGSGTTVGPFTVNFEANSSIRDVVDKINKTYKAAGGEGSIASVNSGGNLVLQTSLMDGSANNLNAYVDIDAGSTALGALGLTAGTTNGTNPTTFTILDSQGVHYKMDYIPGANEAGSNPGKLVIKTNDSAATITGYYDKPSGAVGGYMEANSEQIAEMRQELSDFAMSIKNAVNKVLVLGKTANGTTGQALFTGTNAANFQVRSDVLANNSLITQGKTGAISDGAIAQEVSDLFFGTNNIISDDSIAEKIYLDSNATTTVSSKIALIPGQPLTIYADGIINDNGSQVNAGTNGFGGGSLIQFEFLDASGTVVGATNNFPASAGAPVDRVTFNGPIPAGAAFIRFRTNAATFNDNNVSNNLGHFGLSVIQGTDVESADNLNTKVSDLVGDFGTRGNVAQSKKENSENLFISMDERRQSIMGVSVEEEAANLIRYQNAFSANAKVISIWNQVFDAIINIL